ncbi:hypothetical protein BS47DRAFT_1388281 [Hydnum rufescens UP504]|uniref:GmrSD restriction endonucleases N-terminal domain-containing protein n=1 Tax=Hydnum rufescens UP504 TaxID=1448309 RepID=A0A9P6B826_9AGAM|nr:hypothetical protein BS47DRAFT_1388281 [Hydnum rufescens UP504]
MGPPRAPKVEKIEVNSDNSFDDDDGKEQDELGANIPGMLSPPIADVVWLEKKQIGLILSIAQNYPIPPIYFSLRKRKDGTEYRVCLDGKQRLTSVQKFFDGSDIPEGSKNKYYFTSSRHRKARLELPLNLKEMFMQKPLTCVEYRNLSEMEERDMFQRVQLGMPLKEGEKLQSIGSEWAAWIGTICRKFVEVEDGLQDVLDWGTDRGKGFQCVAAVVAHIHSLPEFSYKSYSQLDKFLREPGKPSTNFQAKIDHVFSTLTAIASTPSFPSLKRHPFAKGTPRVAPVEFYMICVLIYLLREENNAVIALEIQNLRTETRKVHTDIRSNNRVVGTMWQICNDIMKRCSREMRNQRGDDDDDGEYIASMERATKRARLI